MGNARVRPPRLELAGHELGQAREIIRSALRARPQSPLASIQPET